MRMSDFQKLELSTETLRELTADELDAVVGGAVTITGLTGPQPTPPIWAPTQQANHCYRARA